MLLSLVTALTLSHPRAVSAADVRYAQDGTFGKNTVIELANKLAQAPFSAPKSPLPPALANLNYDQYRDIRVAPGATVWAKRGTQFRLQLLPRGFLFVDPVEIALVQDGRAHHLSYRPDMFTTGSVMKSPLPTDDIGFSGLRVLFPLNRALQFDEVAVFQGASYFRAVAARQGYGLSARGLANKTADPQGEEFPVFRAFWVEEPARTATVLVVHALLDSPSVAGAFRFRIDPGHTTVMDVECVLFPRVVLDRIGLGPATSMFMFSPNGRVSTDDFRPELHDSDGLLIVNGHAEHIWRPLSNPTKMQISSFLDAKPAGYGLIQRNRDLSDYQDFEAHYEKRPSLWTEPVGDWGEGAVVLTEIPSDAEIHDNIVAFWRPKTPIAAKAEFRYAYRLLWGDDPKAALDRYRVVATRRGRSDTKAPTPVRRFVIDYAPPPGLNVGHARPLPPPEASVSAFVGEIKDVVVSENPLLGGYRVGFIFDPKDADVSELRIDLHFKDGRSAETWVYRWTGS
jgi:glucans biosynthesis protein